MNKFIPGTIDICPCPDIIIPEAQCGLHAVAQAIRVDLCAWMHPDSFGNRGLTQPETGRPAR
jgi:hypothetical protein